MLALAACGTTELVGADADATTAAHPQAFTITVNARTGALAVMPPAPDLSSRGRVGMSSPDRPSLSLLGDDAVRLTLSNLRTTPAPSGAPGAQRVQFDVAIQNRLQHVSLVTPTWPAPPAPGVILFPVDVRATTYAGRAVGAGDNRVLVATGTHGNVTPSTDFDGTGEIGSGAPYDFFQSAPCAAPARACARWKAFGPYINARATSAPRTIGFDIDASVAQFRALMIVAADLVHDSVAGSGR
jgi:hypothetical protein